MNRLIGSLSNRCSSFRSINSNSGGELIRHGLGSNRNHNHNIDIGKRTIGRREISTGATTTNSSTNTSNRRRGRGRRRKCNCFTDTSSGECSQYSQCSLGKLISNSSTTIATKRRSPYHFHFKSFSSASSRKNDDKPTAGESGRGPIITAAPAPPYKNIYLHTLLKMKKEGKPITMFTAYDFPSAVHVDKAGIDILLVGDSLGMVELGMDTTLPVTMDEMVHHCRAVSRGCRRPLLVGDLPFGSYEADTSQAILNASRLLKEGGMDAVKMEGGRHRAATLQKVVESGIACMGHIGLTPQSYSALGGFRAQGRSADKALRLLEDALALEQAGAFAIVIECVPGVVAKEISKRLSVPTIGIGSGCHTDGQVLVFHDALGMMQHHHHAQVTPSFVKQYAQVGYMIQEGMVKYRDEVRNRTFPDDSFTPYKIPPKEEEKLLQELEKFDASQNSQNSSSSSSASSSNNNSRAGRDHSSGSSTSNDENPADNESPYGN